jgi:hypothetical protein
MKRSWFFCLESGLDDRRPFAGLVGRGLCQQLEGLFRDSWRVHYGTVYTRAELEFYLSRIERIDAPKVIALIGHGQRGWFWLSDKPTSNEGITLERLGHHRLGSCIVHFSTCKTVGGEASVKTFMRRSGVLWVTGYRANIRATDGLVVDLAVTTTMLNRLRAVDDGHVAKTARTLIQDYGDLCKRQGFISCRRSDGGYVWFNRKHPDRV